MEVPSAKVSKGLKGYWNRRRGYEKLNPTASRRRKTARLGVVVTPSPTEAPPKRRFSWRIKLTRKLKFKRFKYIPSPKKLLIGFRDSYINFMNKIANTRVLADGIGGGFGGGATDTEFAVRPMKEYDEKMIIEIYKSILIAQGQLVSHRDAQRIAS